MKNIYLLFIFLLISFQTNASKCLDGSDPVKSVSDDGTYYIFTCNQEYSNNSIKDTNVSSNNSKSESNDSEIKIYEVSFAPEVIDELLNLVVSIICILGWHPQPCCGCSYSLLLNKEGPEITF